MPLYEYRCKKCGHQFEKIQTYSAPDEKECPVCKGEVERLISAPSFQFKGSGWYATDYAAKGKHASGSAQSSGDSKPAVGDGKAAAAESKPAASSSESSVPKASASASASAKSE